MPVEHGLSSDVAVVCDSTRRGGVYRAVSTLCNAWARQGRKVYLITLKKHDSFFRLEPSIHRIEAESVSTAGTAWKLLGRIATLSAKTSAVLKRLCPWRGWNEISLLAASPWLLPRVGPLRAAIRQTETSVVISFGSVANILTILACRNLGRKVVISERNDVGCRPLQYPWEELRSRFYNHADRVTANTLGALRTMQAYVDEEKLTFVPNPIVPPETGSNPNRGGSFEVPFVLIVANLIRLKAHDILLEAFARLSPDLSHWRLAIVGDGELEKTLRRKANVLGIDQRVDWYGLIPDPFPFYRAASIFALPSRSEGMPNALMEAMSCGLPVIVSNASPGPLGLVKDGETGLVVAVDDPAALAKAIEWLANDPALRKRLGDAAHRYVSEYDLSKVMAIWEPIISVDPKAPLGAFAHGHPGPSVETTERA